MTEVLSLSTGVFVTWTGHHARLGAVAQPLHLWDLSPELALCVLRFTRPTAAESALEAVPASARPAVRDFLAELRRHGLLVTGATPAAVPRTAEFELTRHVEVYRDIDSVHPGFSALYADVAEYTFTSPPLAYALVSAVEHVVRNGVDGAIVECGVWRGGSMMLAAKVLPEPRDLWLYDTFEARWEPRGPSDGYVFAPGRRIDDGTERDPVGAEAKAITEEEVLENLVGTGYPRERITTVKGLVQDTIPNQVPERIAVLRLDTDFYESTRHELVHLYPRLASAGVLIIDDYGKHAGATKAVDEYFDQLPNPPLLVRVDVQGRVAVKP